MYHHNYLCVCLPLTLARRFFRFFNFLDCFEQVFALLGSSSSSSSTSSAAEGFPTTLIELGRWTCLGLYFVLEDCTIVSFFFPVLLVSCEPG